MSWPGCRWESRRRPTASCWSIEMEPSPNWTRTSEIREDKAMSAQRGQPVQQVQLGRRDHRDLLERRARLVLRDRLVLLARLVLRDRQVPRARLDPLAHKELPERRARLVLRDPQVPLAR